METALAVAGLLRSPERTKRVATAPGNVEARFGNCPWGDVSLSHGFPGVALLFSELHELDTTVGWDRAAHNHLAPASMALQAPGHVAPSLFGGVGAVAFAALVASRERTRYGRLLDRLDSWLVERVADVLKQEKTRRRERPGSSIAAYDVVVGLSGTGRYLLHCSPYFEDRPSLHEALLRILDYMVNLTEKVEVDGHSVPGWYVAAEEQILESDRTSYPSGNFNCGMAHGVPGPLSLLALASSQNIVVPGQHRAIRRIASWLLRWRQHDAYGSVCWPDRISLEDEVAAKLSRPFFHRDAWCYGTPGVSRALWLAGEALEDSALGEAALEGIHGVFRRPQDSWGAHSPTFCHGIAGLLRITHRFAMDTGDPALYGHVEDLASQLLMCFDVAHPFGFQDLAPDGDGMRGLNVAGLLEGAAGCALTLLSVADESARTWDTAFLIA
jgi:hypothetical protein